MLTHTDGPVTVLLTATSTAADVRLEVAVNRRVSNSAEFVLLLLWSRRRGSPFKARVLIDTDTLLGRMQTIERAGGRCKLSFHVCYACVWMHNAMRRIAAALPLLHICLCSVCPEIGSTIRHRV